MRGKGALKPAADPAALAIGLMAAVQGGYLLADTAHDVRPMRTAIDEALEHVGTCLTEE
jgi:hypothetical protein